MLSVMPLHHDRRKQWTAPVSCGIMSFVRNHYFPQERTVHMSIIIQRVSDDCQGPTVGSPLVDSKFPWAARRREVVRLARIYDEAGYPRYGDRAAACSTWLQYTGTTLEDKTLYAANCCQLRLCPLCTARRARRNAVLLSQVLTAAEKQLGVEYLFLTLTCRNCEGGQLSQVLSSLAGAWHRLARRRSVDRAVVGWFRALEITCNKGQGYHPHIHAVLGVRPDYFRGSDGGQSPDYITHAQWVALWQSCLRVDYAPSVRINSVKATTARKRRRDRLMAARDTDSASQAAALEAAKYAAKSSEFLGPRVDRSAAVQLVRDYTSALHHRRMTAFGGDLAPIAKAVKADTMDDDDVDLIHLPDDEMRDDVATMIYNYRWSLGAGDYLLDSIWALGGGDDDG